MPLPGGLWGQGARRRDYAFKPVTGAVELALAESAGAGGSLQARVTAALVTCLEHVGGLPPAPEVVAELCVADRQYLMQRLAGLLGHGESWFTVTCGVCGACFDFAVDHAGLPAKEASEGYPFAVAETSLGSCRFRVPTGADQEVVAAVAEESAALRVLVGRCLMASDNRDEAMVEAEKFSPADLARIDAALEAVSPEAATAAHAACHACGAVQVIELDPYAALSMTPADSLFQEIHLLASSYHWSEAEILSLPRARRRRYLELIDRSRGLVQ